MPAAPGPSMQVGIAKMSDGRVEVIERGVGRTKYFPPVTKKQFEEAPSAKKPGTLDDSNLGWEMIGAVGELGLGAAKSGFQIAKGTLGAFVGGTRWLAKNIPKGSGENIELKEKGASKNEEPDVKETSFTERGTTMSPKPKTDQAVGPARQKLLLQTLKHWIMPKFTKGLFQMKAHLLNQL